MHITKEENIGGNNGSTIKNIVLSPNVINVKVGETVEVKAEIMDENDQIVTVDNSKFKWSIVTGADAIDIVPNNGNTVQVKAKKVVIGGARIKISHPDADYEIQRAVRYLLHSLFSTVTGIFFTLFLLLCRYSISNKTFHFFIYNFIIRSNYYIVIAITTILLS